jgi:hypothetical protein
MQHSASLSTIKLPQLICTMPWRHTARSGGKPPVQEDDLEPIRSKAIQGIGNRQSTVLASEVKESKPPLIKTGDQTGTWWQDDTETVWRTWTNFTDFLSDCCPAMRNTTTFVGTCYLTVNTTSLPARHLFTFTSYSPWRAHRKANFRFQTRPLLSFNWTTNSTAYWHRPWGSLGEGWVHCNTSTFKK